MASKEFVYLKGKTKWFRHTAPNRFSKWAHDLYLDDESLGKFKKLQEEGVLTHLKKDDDGYVVTLSRPTNLKVQGKIVGMAPPEVLQADGLTPLRDVMVGNGSDVTTKIEAYVYTVPGTNPPKKGKAIRWLSSRIDHLIVFDGKDHFTEEENKAVQGLAEQPPQPLF